MKKIMNKRFNNWRCPLFDRDGYAYDGETLRRYGWMCSHPDKLELGYDCDIGAFTYIQSKYGVKIGDDVQIGSHCSIYSINTENNTKGEVVIGDNSLIGSHCLILPGAVIISGSKIRAYSIVKSKLEE